MTLDRQAPSRDAECVKFLRWALPRMQLRWEGFRKVRRQVCRRARERAAELGLGGLPEYRAYLDRHAQEWPALERMSAITISRFYRDRGVFEFLAEEVLPYLGRHARESGRATLDAWSAGCASGEEPYTLTMTWRLVASRRPPEMELRVIATDVDAAVLRRARRGCYLSSSLKELPAEWVRTAFVRRGDELCLRSEYRRGVAVREHDIRAGVPDGPFDLVLCRNLAFTYFEPELQVRAREILARAVRPGGVVVVGAHERVPSGGAFDPWPGRTETYLRRLHGNES